MKSKFLSIKANGCGLLVNIDTIRYVERNPNDWDNSIWVWTDWANQGYVVVDENIDVFKRKLGL